MSFVMKFLIFAVIAKQVLSFMQITPKERDLVEKKGIIKL